MAVDDIEAPPVDPGAYVDEMVWPPPHWAVAPGGVPTPPPVVEPDQPAPQRAALPEKTIANVNDDGTLAPTGAPGAHLSPRYDDLGATRPLGPGEWVKNKDGSWSNEITTTVQDKTLNGGRPTVIPTLWVVDGRPTQVSEDQAADLAAKSGLRFQSFDTMKDAENFANQREANWQTVREGDTGSVTPLWSRPQAPAPAAAFHPAVAQSLSPPPMPEADAISGGETSDQARAPGAAALQPDAISGGVAPDQAQDVTGAQQLGTDVGTASTERNLENMSPEDRTRVELAREAERTNQYQQQALQALKDQQAREAAAAQVHQQMMTKLQAQDAQDRATAQKLAQTKIETTPGIGGIILGAIAGFVGGLASPFTGGRNLGLEGFQRGLNNWIDAQKAELANKEGLLGKSMALTSDQMNRENETYRQGEIMRAAVYQRAIDKALGEAQNYDPRGTTAQKIADGVSQLKAQQAAAWQQFQQSNFNNQLKVEDARLKESQFLETARHNRAGEGLDYAKFSLDRQKAQQEQAQADQVLTPDMLKQMYPNNPVPTYAMKAKDYPGWLANMDKGQEAKEYQIKNEGADIATAIRDKNGNPYTVNGQIIRAASPDLADKANDQLAHAQDLLDTLGAARRELAASPSGFDKAAYARIRTNIKTGLMNFALANGLKYSTREEEALKDIVGTDYDDFLSRYWSTGKSIASIDQTIANTISSTGNQLSRKYGVHDATSLFDTSQPPPAKRTSVDEDSASVATRVEQQPVGDLSAGDLAFLAHGGPIPYSLQGAADAAKGAPEVKRAITLGIPPSHLEALDRLGAKAQAGDADALAALQAQAEKGLDEHIRSYAQQLVGTALGARALDDSQAK